MKKIILFAVFLIGCAAFTNAQVPAGVKITPISVEQVANDEYKEVKLADLSEVIKNAVKKLAGKTYDVKKVEFNEKKGLTKVIFVNKKDKNDEKTVVLNKEGKEEKE